MRTSTYGWHWDWLFKGQGEQREWEQGAEEQGAEGKEVIFNLCPMPNAPCPILNAP
ncbi:hypothetical protein [Nostoc sp. UIC 10630]|uniref:hypothetical protein n=1 Tax=Nostoc sp. UIC 10630 TaxID=2100146 RepID=UPI0013D5C5F6|nr:hypothetical protein [Nostoc sp. UIC 10630]NEU79042.1 hypothetical protein [Nostoc sp. UIC 10630]